MIHWKKRPANLSFNTLGSNCILNRTNVVNYQSKDYQSFFLFNQNMLTNLDIDHYWRKKPTQFLFSTIFFRSSFVKRFFFICFLPVGQTITSFNGCSVEQEKIILGTSKPILLVNITIVNDVNSIVVTNWKENQIVFILFINYC